MIHKSLCDDMIALERRRKDDWMTTERWRLFLVVNLRCLSQLRKANPQIKPRAFRPFNRDIIAVRNPASSFCRAWCLSLIVSALFPLALSVVCNIPQPLYNPIISTMVVSKSSSFRRRHWPAAQRIIPHSKPIWLPAVQLSFRGCWQIAKIVVD